jgi:tetratricopeptide (TPR) repeat protein
VLFGLAAFLVIRDVAGRDEAASQPAAPLTLDADHGARRDENIAFFEGRVVETNDSLSYNRLVSLYLQRFRETGDVNDIGRAERAALRANEVAPGNYASEVSLAGVRLVQHEFAEAESLARAAIDARPTPPDAWAVLGDALFALGRYDEAGDAYAYVLEQAPGPAAYARQATYAEVRGKLDEAEQYWWAAIDSETESAENRAWSEVQLGNLLFNRGRHDEANDEYERALVAFERYPAALAGMAHVAAARGDTERATQLYALAVDRVPQPEFLIALGDLYAAFGEDVLAEQQFTLVRAIRQLHEANGIDDDLAIVQFSVDHEPVTREVVALARKLAEARPSVDVVATYAWALYRSGDVAEANETIDQALATGARTPLLAFQAAVIKAAAGDAGAARTWLDKLDELNPDFSPLHAPALAVLRMELEGGAK